MPQSNWCEPDQYILTLDGRDPGSMVPDIIAGLASHDAKILDSEQFQDLAGDRFTMRVELSLAASVATSLRSHIESRASRSGASWSLRSRRQRKDEAPYRFMKMPRDQRGFMHADRVLRDGKNVGVATSRGCSYYCREMLSPCVIDVGAAEIDSEVVMIWGEPGGRQKEIRATVAPAPYKRDNRRADLSKA